MSTRSTWQPTAAINTLRERAHIVQAIRDFFASRSVLEVETPLLSHTSVTDPYIHSIAADVQDAQGKPTRYYLQTSPEYAMKRLLAFGSGDIYQITKAFRQDEVGAHHNPEFTMLEWYRIGFDHHALMDEMDALLQFVLKTPPAKRLTYAALFEKYCGVNPHEASVEALKACAAQQGIHFQDTCHPEQNQYRFAARHRGLAKRAWRSIINPIKTMLSVSWIASAIRMDCFGYSHGLLRLTKKREARNDGACHDRPAMTSQHDNDRDLWLTLLMTHHIEPQLQDEAPTFIYDFPTSQAALARIVAGTPPTASRFEVYFKGIELANGFHELQDATQQRARFEANLAMRKAQHLPLLPIDEHFLSALQAGLPDCAGVALGLDRLIMLALQQQRIAQVLSFDWANT